ncbi:glycosyltransferase [bacterium]|nr:glycosyltransferase [bacterium]
MSRLDRMARLVRRTGEVFSQEGLTGVLARVERRLFSPDRKVFLRYPEWAERHGRERPPEVASPPLVSIVTPVRDPPIEVLRATAESVLGQRAARVEWCVADDASASQAVRDELTRIGSRDERVKLALLATARGIAGATNAALELARGELVAFLDHDDVLDPHAIAWMQRAFVDPGVGAAYSDEDKLERSGERSTPFFKPAFSPDLLLNCNYVSHLFLVRHSLLRELDFLRAGFDGSQDYDLALRVSERTRIAHVPRVLYHWRMLPGSVAELPGAKAWAYSAARKALESALERRGERASVGEGAWLGSYRIRRELARPIDLSSFAPGPLPESARGETIAFLDGDLEPEAGALDELVSHARRPDVALAVPRVLAWNRRLESAGLALGFGRARVAACPFAGRTESDPGYFGLARATRDISAAPAGAFVIERSKLEALGGFPLSVPRAHAGIALALGAREAGLRTVLAGEAVLVRRSTHGSREARGDAGLTRRVLGEKLDSEPHLSPHFVRGKERLELP